MASSNVETGIILCAIGGVGIGFFVTPMKPMLKYWRFENCWLLYSVFAILLNVTNGVITIPNLKEVLQVSFGRIELLYLFLLGAGWGLGRASFGTAVKYMNSSAIPFAITASETTAIGSLIPLIFYRRQVIDTVGGILIFVGVFLIIVGMVVVSIASRNKEIKLSQKKRESALRINNNEEYVTFSSAEISPLMDQADLSDVVAIKKPIIMERNEAAIRNITIGLIISCCSGCMAPLMNIVLDVGAGIVVVAREHGATDDNSNNIIWTISITTGFVVNAIYCVILLSINGTWHLFVDTNLPIVRLWLGSMYMGFMWMGGVIIYGIGVVKMGDLGNIVGWALFNILVIIASQFSGIVITKDWKGSGKKLFAIFLVGIFILVTALCSIAVGNFYQNIAL